ncbi:cysteine hydrolase family protein [Neorhizobium alkalisoli]|jgi:nicotinamidase-related amidase|uniref:Nicotinamidase-related amidase n=1 Tax=Neorhizobium alkalisoli TaxID=528178 RepID=A0A561QGP0_9HYPH|nr:isochorismatase family cysteine hydrolase [Neorhizobium alkalisoli]TWF49523.1 nicotinamidase-related amidase [Neorhizobium alkalisoli]
MTEWIHLCIDMQSMFAEGTPWQVPWMASVSPAVVEVAGEHPDRTVFTRFVPPESPEQVTGAWQQYYRKWEVMTLERMDRQLVEVVPELARFIPPARTFDKMTYSPWVDGRLHRILQAEGVGTLAITGGETDVCVLAAVLGAIDLGYSVKLLSDAVCSGADQTHDATLQLLGDRFSVQVEVLTSDQFLRRSSR